MKNTLRIVSVVVVLVLGVGLASCSTNSERTQLRAEMSLSSNFTSLQKVGVDDSNNYGWNRLVGRTESNLGALDVVMLGNVDYKNGSGPFFGFLTFTAPNGDVLSMRMDGSARLKSDGVTALSSKLSIIGGTGSYVDATGDGSFTGQRSAQIGAPIEITVTVGVAGL